MRLTSCDRVYANFAEDFVENLLDRIDERSLVAVRHQITLGDCAEGDKDSLRAEVHDRRPGLKKFMIHPHCAYLQKSALLCILFAQSTILILYPNAFRAVIGWAKNREVPNNQLGLGLKAANVTCN